MDISVLQSFFRNEGYKIKYNILILPSEKPNYFNEGFNVDIINRFDFDSDTNFQFSYNTFRGYYAEYLIQGLRIQNDDDFCLFLLHLYLKELLHLRICSKIIYDLINLVNCYIVKKYGITFGSTREYSANLFSMHTSRFLTNFTSNDSKDLIAFLCTMCMYTWKDFFLENIIIERKINNDNSLSYLTKEKYYDHNWVGYKVLGNKKVLVTDFGITITHKEIVKLVLEQFYSSDTINSSEIAFLDGNPLNTSPENLLLFKTYKDFMRFKEGNTNYLTDINNLSFFPNEIDKDEFSNFCFKYKTKELKKIFDLTDNQIRKKINEYNLPKKAKPFHLK